jgi:flavin-dependent dehydrogenase
VDDAELAGCIVDPAALSGELIKAACKAGAELLRPATVEGLQLGEHSADVYLSDGRSVAGTVVLIADGADSTVAALANLATTRQVVAQEGCASVTLEPSTDEARLDVVLGGGSSGMRLITVARDATTTRVTLLTRNAVSPATDQLQTWIAAAREAKLLPPGPFPQPVALPRLAGAALEMESHVGKRCLLVGDAGGFVTAFSNEGIYPALQSGCLGAQVAADALAAPILQDELATFSARWREDLAEYLRMPNTDLGLLLPMVFKNPQISRRLARAFLLGQAF